MESRILHFSRRGINMNKKAMIEEVVQYILDQDHEREDLIDRIAEDAKEFKRQGMNIKRIKVELYAMRENSIYWVAKYLSQGKRYANNSYRGCIIEALEKL
jgi:anaerobic ribonucleoside-triphosphate reductase